MQPAKFYRRFLAASLDSIVFVLLTGISQKVLARSFQPPTLASVLALAQIFIFIGYYIYPVKKSGQTFGKKIFGLQIISTDIELTYFNVFMREFVGKLLSILLLGIGYLLPFFNSEKRALHDYLAKTQVVSIEDESESSSWIKTVAAIVAPSILSLGLCAVLLYTSMPLSSIRQRMEAQGLQVDSLSGSIAGGLHFKGLAGYTESYRYDLEAADIAVDLWALLRGEVHIRQIEAHKGILQILSEKPLAMDSVPMPDLSEPTETPSSKKKKIPTPFKGKLVIDHFELSDLSFKTSGSSDHSLQKFKVKGFELSPGKMTAEAVEFAIAGVQVDLNDVSLNASRFSIASLRGELGPELIGILKNRIHFKGSLTGDFKGSDSWNINVSAAKEKIKLAWSNKQLLARVDNISPRELFKTSLPIDSIRLAYPGTGGQTVSASLNICGNEFSYLPNQSYFLSEKSPASYRLTPIVKKPVSSPMLLLEPNISLDDYLSARIEVDSANQDLPQALSHLCFNKEVATLSPEEQKKIQELGSLAQMTPPPQRAIASVDPAVSAITPLSLEQFRKSYNDSKSLLKTGKMKEALEILPKNPPPDGIGYNEKTTYLRYVAWLYLYNSEPQKAGRIFVSLLQMTHDISDAEGLLRVSENTGDKAGQQQWENFIKESLKKDPSLGTRLTPNMRQKMLGK